MLVTDVLRILQSFDLHAIFPSLDTAYAKYSNTNHVAASWEVPPIREIISRQKKQLHDIDAIIDQTKFMIDQLHKKREEITSSLKANECLVSSIRRLPLEVLREIFVQCLPQTTHVKPSTQSVPLLLMRICKGWREVALNTPRLWCPLDVLPLAPSRPLSIYHDWLEKAKGYPLSLRVNIFPPSHHPGWRQLALGFVKHHSNRLIDLRICFDTAHGLDLLFEDTPLLERLSLVGDMGSMRRAKPISIQAAQLHPCLRTLVIHSSAFNFDVSPNFKPGWANLTHLAVLAPPEDDFNPDDSMFWTLLEMCRNLEHFVFYTVSIHNNDDSVSLTHSKLRFLGISEVYHGHGSLVNSLSLPNLRQVSNGGPRLDSTLFQDVSLPAHPPFDVSQQRVFSVSINDEYRSIQDSDLFTAFNPGWTTLTHLTVELRNDEDIVCALLQLCPNLEDLTISSSFDTMLHFYETPPPTTHQVLRSLSLELCEAVFLGLSEQLTLPNLRHLDLSFFGGWSPIHRPFKEFLSRSSCPLEMLRIRRAKMSMEEQEEFATLIPTLQSLELHVGEDSTADWTTYSWTR